MSVSVVPPSSWHASQLDRLARRDPRYATLLGRKFAGRLPLPCVFEGGVVEWCVMSNQDRHVRDCDVHDRCTRGYRSPKVKACDRCKEYETAIRTKINPGGLIAAPRGYSFNGSVVRHNGTTWLAYRTGWRGSRIAVCQVDLRTGEHGASQVLRLSTPPGLVGHEDPRLFVYKGRLHVSYTAYSERSVGKGKKRWTDVLYARLTDDFQVEQEFVPWYKRRQAWEKNWVFFEGLDGLLYCVYSVSPHVVLRVDGSVCEEAGRTECPIGWNGGHLRGGCPPVLVGDEYWHWFHGAKEAGEPNRRYSVGLYTFASRPPFAVSRHFSAPVAWASEGDFAASGNYCRVVFPGGAVLDDGAWRVSCGVHDRRIEIWSWEHAELDKALSGAS